MVILKNKYIKAFLLIISLIVLNFIAQYYYLRFDFTKEKRYTLHPKTKETLESTTKEVVITVFLDGEIPSAFKRLKNATHDLLIDYKALADVPVKIVFEDPLKDISAQEQQVVIEKYASIGINPIVINLKNDAGLTQKLIFPMAIVAYGDLQMPINLLQKTGGPAVNYEENITSSIQNLEYTFTTAFKRLMNASVPRVGFTEGHGEPSNLQLNDAINSLSQNNLVGRVDLNLINKQGLDSLSVLFIVKPKKPFTESEKYKINYFVMKGGKVVWAIDQVNAELDSLQKRSEVLATNQQLNLDDMLFEYGARINYNLVKDVNCSMIPVLSANKAQQSTIDMAPWLYFPILNPVLNHNLVKNIDGLKSQFLSTVDTIGVANVAKSILLETSPFNKVIETPTLLSLQMVAEQPNGADFNNSKSKIAGVLLAGKFKSVFLNRSVPDSIKEDYQLPAQSVDTKMIVIGDGDIFSNQVGADQTPFPLGFDRYTQENYGNKALLLNIVDYFTTNDNLIELRNKEVKVRLLDKVKLKEEKNKWQLINAILPIVMLICLATFQHYYRKHKYAK